VTYDSICYVEAVVTRKRKRGVYTGNVSLSQMFDSAESKAVFVHIP